MTKYMTCFIVTLLVVTGCADRTPTQNDDRGHLSFVEIAEEAGLGDFKHETGAAGKKWFPETMGSGLALADFDGDSWIDILLVGGGNLEPENSTHAKKLWYFRGTADGRFQEVTDQPLLENLDGYGFGLTVADYDNDGDPDIFFSTLGPNHLLKNNGGVFEDVSSAAGIIPVENWSSSAIFFDGNNDGWLDLYVGNYVQWSPQEDLFCSLDGTAKAYCTPQLYEGTPGVYYESNGNGTFTDRTVEAGFGETGGKNLGVASLDFNRDGWQDLVVANDTDPDQLFTNNGDGTFTETGVVSGIAFDERGRARAGMGIDTGIVDDTAEESIFVGNFSNQMMGVYRHVNEGAFLDRAATSQIGRSSMLTLTFGLFLFDVDLDSDLDVFAVNGHVQPSIESIKDNVSFRQPSHLFLNDGSGTFSDAAATTGLADSLVGRGAAYADFDNDGDLDIFVTENGGSVKLYRNDLSEKRFLRVDLVGTAANREGIGSTVTLYSNGRPQSRNVRTGSSFLSHSETTVTFGLADAESIDSVVVAWPGGARTLVTGVQTNQTISITEAQ